MDQDGQDFPPGVASQEDANGRVEAVQAAADVALADGATYAAATPHGQVHICDVTSAETDGVAYVEVTVAGETVGGDPHFRIFNPPTLVPDPDGPVEVRGRTYREDPMAALACVIANQGGATARRSRR